jgi:hypothetical protein
MEQNLYRWAEQAADVLALPAWTGERESVSTILDLSKEAAHRVARPAAPVTSFLAGVAVGLAGAGGPEDLQRAVAALLPLMPDTPDTD